MKLTLSAKRLAADLKALLPATPTRSGLPILSGVLLDASEQGLAMETTDLELTARRVVGDGVTVHAAGTLVVPAKALAKAVAAMDEPQITLESTDGGALDVQAASRAVTLQGWPTDDWPKVLKVPAIEPIASIDASAAAEVFERVARCASDDEARPVLTCVALFFEDPPALQVVSTDSYRLGVVRIPLVATFRVSDGPLLVPARAIRLLARQLKNVGHKVHIRAVDASTDGPAHTSHIAFSVADAEWTLRTVEGEFPNWRLVVPEPEGGLLEFDPHELTSALRVADSVRSKTRCPVRLLLGDACSLAISEPGVSEMRQLLTEASYTPNGAGPMQVALNPVFLADAVTFCGVDRGRMWVRDPVKPVLFEGTDRRHVLMPVRMP